MRNSKKTLIVLLAMTILLGAIPAFAQLNGDWKGTGEGVCTGPISPPPDIPIYAWQSWEGVIYTSPDQEMPIFEGKWEDETGNYGNFKGEILWISETQAYAEGSWTWFYATPDEIKEYDMGEFNMLFDHFPVETPYCNGKWWTNYSGEDGSMEGRMIF